MEGVGGHEWNESPCLRRCCPRTRLSALEYAGPFTLGGCEVLARYEIESFDETEGRAAVDCAQGQAHACERQQGARERRAVMGARLFVWCAGATVASVELRPGLGAHRSRGARTRGNLASLASSRAGGAEGTHATGRGGRGAPDEISRDPPCPVAWAWGRGGRGRGAGVAWAWGRCDVGVAWAWV